jgi:hypothetical protein
MDHSLLLYSSRIKSSKKIGVFLRPKHLLKNGSMERQAICAIMDGTGTKQWNSWAVLAMAFWLSYPREFANSQKNPVA